ncbi:PaaX family transcriptional regulator [Streptomyces sp. GMY02]|uniref:PaaX family transcriptional regulator n=1 Tax=Streptomyces sp. GMY02 TaxID=1333528 RepID=UPI001C2CC1BF|nr:PaaX family transcriptional regulator C-terminal domain-containing protein [Streptomyces sp. GMY02]QXE34202.1 PaaX family transcriptional regulator [Streptomyces sp. GMY02]
MAEQHTPRSLIVTLYGAYGRTPDGAPLAVAGLIRLLGALGVDAPAVRSSVSRLKRRGLLVPGRTAEGAAGYALSAEARELLDDGDRRIYDRPAPRLSDGWVLAVFSVPEAERHKRHLLRSRLGRLGFGTAAPGVWIAPGRLYEETSHTLSRLGLDGYVDLFRGDHLGFETTSEAVARWWDLDAIATRHEEFLAAHEPVLRAWADRREVPPEDAYRDYLLALDSWRHLPYTDPGLPADLLPKTWPGERSAEVFAMLHAQLRDAGLEFVRESLGAEAAETAETTKAAAEAAEATQSASTAEAADVRGPLSLE